MHVLTVVLWFALGIALLVLVMDSAIRTFLLPRGASAILTRAVFIGVRLVFNAMARAARTYDGRDSVMSLYGPIGLLALPAVWMVLVLVAFTAMFHALGVQGFERAFEMSGSSLFTLGFVRPPDLATNVLAFLEAATGLTLLGLLIAYLPTIYGAFSRREVQVAQLEVRAGNPPSGVHVLVQAQKMERFHLLDDFWRAWQIWFTELEETHTSLGVLSFFRSPVGHRSWVTASGAVLDAASLRLAAVDLPFDPEAGICVRAGFFALRAVADYFGIPYDPDPHPGDTISITKEEFLEACDQLVEVGLPVRADREAAWFDFTGWRVNYDVPLISLAGSASDARSCARVVVAHRARGSRSRVRRASRRAGCTTRCRRRRRTGRRAARGRTTPRRSATGARPWRRACGRAPRRRRPSW